MGGVRGAMGAAVLLLVCAMTRSANAGESARLDYERAPGAESCPDESELRRSVVTRLGYDPFASQSRRSVVVRLRRDGGQHRGSVVVDGAAPSLFAAADCGELVESLGLTISVALDPMGAFHPAAAPLPVPPPVPPPPVVSPPPPPVVSPPPSVPTPIHLAIGAGPTFGNGDAPAAVLGGLVYFSARRGPVGGLLEGNATFAGSAHTALGRVSSWSANGVVGLCGYLSIVFACAVGSFGILNASSDSAAHRSDKAFVGFVGPRVGVVLPLGERLELRIHAEALAAFSQHRFAIDGVDVYELGPGQVGLAAALGFRFE